MTIDPNDPRLTAYALGELDEKERAEIEALLAKSEDARREVEEIRRTSELLTQELAAETAPGLSDAQRAALATEVTRANRRTSRMASGVFSWRHLRRPLGIAASLLFVASVGYMLLPDLEAARSPARRPDASSPSTSLRSVEGITAQRRGYLQQDPSYSVDPNAPGELWTRPMRHARSRVKTPDGSAPVDFNSGNVSYGYEVPFGPNRKGRSPQRAPGERSWSDAFRHLAMGPFSPDHPDSGFDTEAYDHIVENPFLLVAQEPLSTFSIDVDTASYANIRRFLTSGQFPPAGAVRLEEMINYFTYDYPQPADDDSFSVNVEMADCPWDGRHRLARIGLKGYEVADDERPASNLVFLIDVSGSMQPANKLPLLKQSMRMLVNNLGDDDSVAIVVYAGSSGEVLSPTYGFARGEILAALDRLQSGGSTNGGAGIQLAYDLAVSRYIEGGINRVILATDGDFNVGVTSQGELVDLIERKAKSGVFLTVLGFGMGNLKDSTLEKLADKGNGNYAYIDTLNEAQKVLVDEMGATLMTIAKDVKIQIEFNPATVAAYRLLGYENRLLAAQDFNDDTKDAGEIGAGHTVTALYEIVPAGEAVDDVAEVDPLKYQAGTAAAPAAMSGETMTVKLRYKHPEEEVSSLIEVPVTDSGASLAGASDDFAFAAAVASFGMLLRDSAHVGDWSYDAAIELAGTALGDDPFGYRAEFVDLVARARELDGR